MDNALPMGAYQDSRLERNWSYTCVRRQSDQAIAASTDVTIDFLAGAEVIEDDDGMFDTASPAKLTVIRGGVYMLTANVRFEYDTNGRRDINFVVGTDTIASIIQNPLTGFATDMALAVVTRLETDDEIELHVRQTSSTGSIDVISNTFSPRIAVVRLMP